MNSVRIVAIAALIGFAAVYVTFGGRDNASDAPEAASSSTAADNTAKPANETAKAVPKGKMAAFVKKFEPEAAPDITFQDASGADVKLSSFKGKTILLNVWATWCAPCRAEMPALDSLQRDKGSDKFEVVAVNVDTGDDVKPRKFLEETGVHSLAYYRENTLSLFESLKKQGLALGLPVTLLVDPQGCLIASMNGPAEWSGADAHRLIDKALGR